jgi:hypothetical protein
MNDILGFLANPNFMPHGHCYLWQPDILWTHVISDLVIALAYYAIPILLGIFLYKRRQNIPFVEIVALFVAFIFLCGTTHLIRIYVTWYPAYAFEGWVKALTALVSIATAIVLVPKLPQLITLPGIQQAYQQSQEALKSLKRQKQATEIIYSSAIDREQRIVALKHEVNALLAELRRPARYLQDDHRQIQ